MGGEGCVPRAPTRWVIARCERALINQVHIAKTVCAVHKWQAEVRLPDGRVRHPPMAMLGRVFLVSWQNKIAN